MNNSFVLVYSGFFICSLILAFLLNGLFLRFSRTMGVRANPDMIRWSTTAKPAVGGISFYVMFLLSMACYTVFFPYRLMLVDKVLLAQLGVVTLAFIMGLADDAYNTKPLLKLFVQIMCGLILVSTGQVIQLFSMEWMNQVLTVAWVVGIMNSINMLDNMDGISTIVSIAICVFTLYVNMYFNMATSPVSLITLTIIGTLCGFLIYNWHPSKIFMGDTGSQFLGVFLAFCGIDACWNAPVLETNNLPLMHPVHNLVIVSLVFVMPLIDTIIVVINRMMRGSSPFVGGRDHTTHFMFFNGVTEKRIAIIFFLINGLGGFLAFLLISRFAYSLELDLAFAAYPVLLFFFLFYLTHRKKQ